MAETANKTAATEAASTADTVGTLGTDAANIAPATSFSTSGAPVQIVPDVDPSHPAVDNDPRAGTSLLQNKIDFNDPTKSGHQVVAEKLGMKVDPDLVSTDTTKPKA